MVRQLGKRPRRVGEQICRSVATILQRSVKDPRVKLVTITGAEVSNDLRVARVFFAVAGEEEASEVEISRALEGLQSAQGYIKRELGQSLDVKVMPDLVFKYDPTGRNADRIEFLLEQVGVRDATGNNPGKVS